MRGFLAGTCLVGLIATSGGPACAAVQARPERIDVAITDVNVVDVELGQVAGPRTVLIADGRVVAITVDGAAAAHGDVERVDGRGRFLIPGLVDLHVHLFNNATGRPPNDWAFPLFLANGVTAVREMAASAGDMAQVARWNEAVASGVLAAPRIVAAGIPARGATADAARGEVAAAKLAGADFVKVFSEVNEDSWTAIRVAARDHGLPIVGHVPATMPLLAAAQDGLRSNEHLTQAGEACSTIEGELLASRRALVGQALVELRDAQERQALDAFDPRTCQRVAASVALTGQVQVPTLVLPDTEARLGAATLATDPRRCYLRADEWMRWQRIAAALPPDARALAVARRSVTLAIARSFHQAGVVMLAGTDAPMPGVYPGFSLQDELGLLVDTGLTPREALLAATLAPARFLGLTRELGSIAVGKRADLVLLDANPLLDIGNARRIHAVLIGGRVLDRGVLAALLESAAAGCDRRGAPD